jgi:hypothetical protein
VAATIINRETRKGGAYAVVGDMNDPPESEFLAPLVQDPTLGLANGLADPRETRPAKADNPPPQSKAWTHRFKESGKPAECELFDQIWLSPALAAKQTDAAMTAAPATAATAATTTRPGWCSTCSRRTAPDVQSISRPDLLEARP